MIEIQDLKELSVDEIIDLLLEEKTQPFEIYVPKSTQRFFSELNAIWLDYAYLAYSGQLLYNVSDEFTYEEVPPEEHESVLFKIKASDIEKLAETLLYISYGYVNDNEDEEFNYTEYADDHLYQVEHGNIIPACPYFIQVCNEFAQDIKEESNEE